MDNSNITQIKSSVLELLAKLDISGFIKYKEIEVVYPTHSENEIKLEGRVPKSKQLDLDEFREELSDLLSDRIGSEAAMNFINDNFLVQVGLSEGEKFNSIDVFDFDGNKKAIKHEAGTVLVIDFWATWCKYCQDPMQENINILSHDKTLQEKGVSIIGVSCDEDTGKWKDHLNQKGWRVIPQYVKPTVLKDVGIKGIPCIGIVGKEGKLVYWGHPASINLLETLKSLVAGGPVKEVKNEDHKANPLWDDLDSTSKIVVVSEANFAIKDAGLLKVDFLVSSRYAYDLDTKSVVPGKVTPVFYGEVLQHEYELLQNVATTLQDKYNFEDFDFRVKVQQFNMDEDF